MKIKDRIGQRKGQLVVLSFAYRKRSVSGRSKIYLLCKCDCGKQTTVESSNFTVGHTLSCGCLHAEAQRKRRSPNAGFLVLFREYRNSARKARRQFALSEEQVRRLTSQDCHYCGRAPNQTQKSALGHSSYIHNGIDRVNNDLGYVVGNVVPCCWPCNDLKNNRSKEIFLDLVKRIYENSFKQIVEEAK